MPPLIGRLRRLIFLVPVPFRKDFFELLRDIFLRFIYFSKSELIFLLAQEVNLSRPEIKSGINVFLNKAFAIFFNMKFPYFSSLDSKAVSGNSYIK